MSTFGLERIFTPKRVAVVGGSPRSPSIGALILKNLAKGGFSGEIAVVNSRYDQIGELKTYPNLKNLPFVPDLIVVTAPAPAIPEIIIQAGKLGVAGAVIISSGLGHGPGSIAEAAEQAARAHKLRIVGPNCLGIMFPGVGLNASFAARHPAPGSLALISQSGAIAAAMVDWGAEKSVGFSGIVSIGDQLDVDVADLLDYFALDDKTRAILLYLEAVTDARKFMSAARAAARLKPVVVVKSGRMAQGAKAAATHTGALAGSDAVYDAAFRRAGLLRVLDLRELFDCAELLGRHVRGPGGKNLTILTNGGGIGILAVDRLVELGGTAPPLDPVVSAKLNEVLPPTWSKANPIDIAGDADADRYLNALDVVLNDPSSDAVLVMNVETAVAPADRIAEAVAKRVKANRTTAGASSKPVLAAWVGTDQRVAQIFDQAEIPLFPTEDDAVRAFMHLVKHREATEALLATPPDVSSLFTPDVSVARKIVGDALRDGRSWLDPIEIAGLFKAYAIPMVPTLAAGSPDEAVAMAETFLAQNIAVAIKILSRDITHKSDVGGVVLGLTTKPDVRDAAASVMANAKRARPEARIEGVMVQPMIVRPGARELIVGLTDDPTFGPVIAFGRGGTAVEVINDKALALPPLDMNLARSLIGRTRVSRLLVAYRDVQAVPPDAVPLILVKLSQMAADLPEIHELDINPLLADQNGVLALDARVGISMPAAKFAGRTRFAVRPYPTEWERQLQLRDGRTVCVRPMRPDDEPAIVRLLQNVSPEDFRLRFFHSVKEFSHQFVGRLTQLDYARAMAFVALDSVSKEVIGVVRLHSDSRYETAEYAILLRSELKGKGLGWALMQLLIEYARAEGLKSLFGEVLNENTTMLAMCRELGFKVTSDPKDLHVLVVSFDLGGAVKEVSAQRVS
ncbi:GNAT family N-acetyltransferase [Bradyrhizobium sp.]|uniref:bifunctional acetate--CoA ligase family protein/GNAT family N-acetyltransferase n=1 Tax=Bradyrhizobium sp. TaxID=376 RepID=UPI003C3353B3